MSEITERYIVIPTFQNADYREKNITVFEIRTSKNPRERINVLKSSNNSKKGMYHPIYIGRMYAYEAKRIAKEIRLSLIDKNYKIEDGYVELCTPALHSDNEFCTQHIDVVYNYIKRAYGEDE